MKKGFKITMTFEAIDALFRSHQSIGEFPTGILVDSWIDHEREIINFKYLSEDESICKVGEACEFPTRPIGLVVSNDIKAYAKVIFPEEKE